MAGKFPSIEYGHLVFSRPVISGCRSCTRCHTKSGQPVCLQDVIAVSFHASRGLTEIDKVLLENAASICPCGHTPCSAACQLLKVAVCQPPANIKFSPARMHQGIPCGRKRVGADCKDWPNARAPLQILRRYSGLRALSPKLLNARSRLGASEHAKRLFPRRSELCLFGLPHGLRVDEIEDGLVCEGLETKV